MIMGTKTNATFVAYSGTNPEIMALVGQEGFEIETLADNCLQIRKGSLEITTSPILATDSARAFEYEVTTYKRKAEQNISFLLLQKIP